MQRSRGKPPLWGRQVVQTVRGIRSRSKRRSLKSSNVYECLCLFARWLEQSHPRLSIAAVDAPCIRRYFSYLEHARHYKRFSLQIVQVVRRCDKESFPVPAISGPDCKGDRYNGH